MGSVGRVLVVLLIKVLVLIGWRELALTKSSSKLLWRSTEAAPVVHATCIILRRVGRLWEALQVLTRLVDERRHGVVVGDSAAAESIVRLVASHIVISSLLLGRE